MRDFAQQQFNAHALTPRGRLLTVTSKGRHQYNQKSESWQCRVARAQGQ